RSFGVLHLRLGLTVIRELERPENRLADAQYLGAASVILIARYRSEEPGLGGGEFVLVPADAGGHIGQQLPSGLREPLAPCLGVRARGPNHRILYQRGLIGLRQRQGRTRRGGGGRQDRDRRGLGPSHQRAA